MSVQSRNRLMSYLKNILNINVFVVKDHGWFALSRDFSFQYKLESFTETRTFNWHQVPYTGMNSYLKYWNASLTIKLPYVIYRLLTKLR